MKTKLYLTGLLACFVLAACNSTTPPVFYYGDYQTAVYQYFKGDELSIDEQISIVQNVIEQAAVNGLPVAPGVHAHLGLLYFESGNPASGIAQLEQEKTIFPESASYIDFLISNIQQGGES